VSYIWTTKDKRKIPIAEMTNSHLLNALRMVSNEIVDIEDAERFFYHPVWGPHGDMATYYAEQEVDRMLNKLPTLLFWEEILGKEAEKRKLAPLPIKERFKFPEIENIEYPECGGMIVKLEKAKK